MTNSQLQPLSDIFMDIIETIEHEGEVKFHSVTNVNCKCEGETLELYQQGGLNTSLKSLVVIKIAQ